MPWSSRILTRLLRRLRRTIPSEYFPYSVDAADLASQLEQLVRVADAARDAGDTLKAADAYAAALTLSPERVDLAVQYGNMLKDSGSPVVAEAVYRAALEAQPGNADIHLQLGHALKLQGRRNEALSAYGQAVSIDPASYQAINELANAGQPIQLRSVFETQFRAGGIEALLGMSLSLLTLRAQVDSMLCRLPDALASAAFPTEQYPDYRSVFSVPPPPEPAHAPHIAVILLVDREPIATLHAQVAAFQAQTWPHRLLIAAGTHETRRDVVDRAAASDTGIKWVAACPGRTEAETERACALAAPVDWVVLLAPGAVLDPQALAWIAAAAGLGPSPAFIWDGEQGEIRPGHVVRSNPVLRQAVDYDSLLESNLYGESLAVHLARYAAFTPLSNSSSQPERSSLLLSLCRDGGVGHIPFPLSWSLGAVAAPDADAHRLAVAAHLAGTGTVAVIEGSALMPGSLSIMWQAGPEPMHVVIPTRDNAADVARLVAGLRSLSAWPEGLSITIIDNGGRDAAMLRILEQLATTAGVVVQTNNVPFNWSRLNNEAVGSITSPLLVFANDDMRMLSPGWDAQLRGLLQRPEVGAVGVRLLYEDDTVQHAGVLLGWKGSTIHDGLYESSDSPGPGGRLQTTRAVSAVTGAFLATRRNYFLTLGGFDDVRLPVTYSDIDFCLKIRSLGMKVIWTPHVTLTHHESKSRGLDHTDPGRQARNHAERDVFEARWADWLDSDPGVNPAWHDATLPFKLLSSPSAARVKRHIVRCATANPWLVTRMPWPR